jgi:hypothetical protein
MIKSLKFSLFCILLTVAVYFLHPDVCTASEITIENDFWKVTVQPDYGGRSSQIYSKTYDYDFVVKWTPSEDKRMATGGAFAGSMVGSFVSFRDPAGQMSQKYEVVEKNKSNIRLRWEHKAVLFKGLEEERTITLENNRPEISLGIKVTNRSDEKRMIAYRFQDWLGTGRNLGYESVYIVPQSGNRVHTYLYQPSVITPTLLVPNPSKPWYAVVDLPRDVGLLVKVEASEVGGFSQWFPSNPDPEVRTTEIFYPVVRLNPGEAWKTKITFTAFKPSASVPEHIGMDEANHLKKEVIVNSLLTIASSKTRSGPPLNAKMHISSESRMLKITPVHPTDALLGTNLIQDYGGTLQSIHLYGTPGEPIPLAFSVTARCKIGAAKISFTNLYTAGRLWRKTIQKESIEAWFASTDGQGYLLKNWGLARNLPEEVGGINNSLKDAPELTPFSLSEGEHAGIWALLRLPENTVPGDYSGKAVIKTEGGEEFSFLINLTVYPFSLLKPEDKIYGAAFRYHLKTGKDDAREYAVEKPVLRKALEGITELGFRTFLVYGNRDETLWKIDQCVELGWRNASFIITSWNTIAPDELRKRYGNYNFRFYAWAIDEPRSISRGDIERTLSQHSKAVKIGYQPFYSCNSPFALIFAELLPDMVPCHVMNSPLFLDVTRRYSKAGRDIYWYAAELSERSNTMRTIARLRRGIYFWKEPVNGFLDWGEDSIYPKKSDANTIGFAGTEVLHRTGRENIRQALTDMYYLYTLEQKVMKTRNETAKKEAKQFLSWIKEHFNGDPSYHAQMIGDLGYLDSLRREAAELIIKIMDE